MYIITENGRTILKYNTKKEAEEALKTLRNSMVEWWGIDTDTSVLQLKYVKE